MIFCVYCSRAGVFDWALGRSEVNWTYHQNFMREYTGMSLRGLLWTGPAGYALNMLGLGWYYSLAGSWMGLVYYLGGKTPNWDIYYAEKNLNGQIPWSELYWGWWIWFILELSCISYLIKTIRKHFGVTSNSMSLLNNLWNGYYEILMFIINIIFACSVGFYQLVQQKDMRNKGQTFFGLFTGVLFLTFVQAFNWGCWWNGYHSKRRKRRQSGIVPSVSVSTELPNDTTPLLPWPQNHPNASQEVSNRTINDSSRYHTDERRQTCKQLWDGLEMTVHLDSFRLLQWFLGMLSAVHTVLVLILFLCCVIMDSDSPRLMPYYKINPSNSEDYYYYYYYY